MALSPYVGCMTPADVQQLTESVVTDGFHPHRDALDALVADARRRGVDPVLLDVLAGADEPPVARLRALGRVTVQYVAIAGSGRRSACSIPAA